MAEKKGWIPDLRFRAERDKKARERIRKEQDSQSVDDLILQGRYARAQQLLELRIAENPEDVHSHIKLGDLLAQKRKTDEALRNYLRAAQLLSEDGFFDKSLALLKTARKLSSGESVTIDAMEETVLRAKELDTAAWSVRKGKGSEGSALSVSIELEALWRRMSEGDFVQGLAHGQLEVLMDAMELHRVPAGEFIAREGENDPALYLIASGLVQARLDPLRRDLLLRNFGPGQVIGESVLFERRPWPASYKAAHNCQLLRLDVGGLQRALAKTKARRQLITGLSSQRNDQQVAALASSVASSD
ncbi:MAG TPA: cyclic nucleotide-binding domain-containing protein [Thermoanaerobaculia bacterium]|nr:cyclic nucleotide-binding domain-containing protein [Thermoanaerobaculia bacterium]